MARYQAPHFVVEPGRAIVMVRPDGSVTRVASVLSRSQVGPLGLDPVDADHFAHIVALALNHHFHPRRRRRYREN